MPDVKILDGVEKAATKKPKFFIVGAIAAVGLGAFAMMRSKSTTSIADASATDMASTTQVAPVEYPTNVSSGTGGGIDLSSAMADLATQQSDALTTMKTAADNYQTQTAATLDAYLANNQAKIDAMTTAAETHVPVPEAAAAPATVSNASSNISVSTAPTDAKANAIEANSAAWKTATTQKQKDALHAANVALEAGTGKTYNTHTGKWS